MHKTLSPLGILVLSTALCLPGCASQYGEQRTKVNHYPQCYEPVTQLREDENTVGKSTAAGAASGAIIGAIIGFASTGKASGAVAGAAAGGATGAVAGNVYGKKKVAQKDAALLAKYTRELDEDTTSMTRTTAAAKVALKCYSGEFDRAVSDYKAGRITRDELADRYQEIRSGLQEVSYILTQKYDNMAKKDTEYEQALAEDFTAAQPATQEKQVHNRSKNYRNPQKDAATNWKTAKQDMGEARDTANYTISAQDRRYAELAEESGNV